MEPTIETLRALPLFADVSDDALQRLAAHAAEVVAPAGTVLVEVGQPGTGMLILDEGELAVELRDGQTVQLGPGEFVGELSLLIDEPRTARVRAAVDIRCWAIARADFEALLRDDPRVAVAMLPVLARRLHDRLA